MGKFYNEIQKFHVEWIMKQKVFWVASAPLVNDGYVNVSPKGVEGSFHIVSSTQVWYEDLTGSGKSWPSLGRVATCQIYKSGQA